MKLTILELAASWGQPARVLSEISARIAAGPATDLVLVPEAALHGYVSPDANFDVTKFAEPIDGPTAKACAAVAAAHRVHLVSSLVLREGDKLFNAMTCFDPQGQLVFVYRKRHPWMPETWATDCRQRPPVVDIAGVNVTIAICYDLHFMAEVKAELTAADVLLFPSAWVEKPDTRPIRLTRLAAKHDLQIANANWAAGVVSVPGQGSSCVVAPDGTITTAPPLGRLDVEVLGRAHRRT